MKFFKYRLSANAIHTSEKHGSDETGDGSEAKPFKTAARVFFKSISSKCLLIYIQHFPLKGLKRTTWSSSANSCRCKRWKSWRELLITVLFEIYVDFRIRLRHKRVYIDQWEQNKQLKSALKRSNTSLILFLTFIFINNCFKIKKYY